MATGDRILNPDGGGYASHEITDETTAQGWKQAAQLVKLVGDSGATIDPSAPVPATGAAAGASLVSSTALENGRALKASAGTLISLVGYNAKTSAQFIQVHNSAAVPADTAVPAYVFTVPASSNFSLDVPVTGAPFTTGISVCNSSTAATKTIGAADCWFAAVIK